MRPAGGNGGRARPALHGACGLRAPALAAALACLAGGCRTRVPPASPAAAVDPPRPAFVDTAAAAGVRYRANEASQRPRDFLESNGSGCAFLDYDGDGRLDLLLAGAPRCRP